MHNYTREQEAFQLFYTGKYFENSVLIHPELISVLFLKFEIHLY